MDQRDRHETLVVVWPRTGDAVDGRAQFELGRQFLQSGLVVESPGPFRTVNDLLPKALENDLVGPRPVTVDVDRTDHSLEGIGENGLLGAAARHFFTPTEAKIFAQPDVLGHVGQRRGVHHRRPQLGQLTLGKIGVGVVDVRGDRQADNSITKELEPLVRFGVVVLGAVAPVREREGQKRFVTKRIAQSLIEGVLAVGSDQDSAPALA